jgi:probable rRNA maturation factor
LANAKRLFSILKIPKTVEVSVVLVSPSFMRDLNRRYRGRPESTDVLSFGADAKERRQILRSGQGMLGEIFICPQFVPGHQQRSPEFIAGLTRLLVHAILHIKGYNHDAVRSASLMDREERKILRTLKRVHKIQNSKSKIPIFEF